MALWSTESLHGSSTSVRERAADPGFVAATVFAVVGAPAQQDQRDCVTLRDGRELRGRVFSRYEPELVIQNVTRRERNPEANVHAIDTVRNRVAEFLLLSALRSALLSARVAATLYGSAIQTRRAIESALRVAPRSARLRSSRCQPATAGRRSKQR